ncbi:metallophosphoesterase [Listeria newyorkensis]|uniref:Calcineurin-like phosphoesterase domain-containing protein n=1 Tax=Listeria newyorkensis TaxID=1497681 RepID=A0A841YSA1_9LIST|nr:metallophosphoesterase [Listeria newyorkensis]MBC1456270.1 hypothetical protein [Listeria newyorkensis]
MKQWFISDTHYWHANILEFCNRKRMFADEKEMTERMVANWNAVVADDDIVYHCGDFSFGKSRVYTSLIISQLKGKIVLVKGNHDSSKDMRWLQNVYAPTKLEIVDAYRFKLHKQLLYLSHFPLEIGNCPNMWNVSGHVHDKPNTHIDQINVGCDSAFYASVVADENFGRPISATELLAEVARRS